MSPLVSLIIPIYRAERFLQKSLEEIDRYLLQSGISWELILTVDASPDASAEICQKFKAASHPYPVQVLVNETNLGKGGNVRRGMLAATGDYRIFTDCDLAYSMEDVGCALATLQGGSDVVVASRVHRDSCYTIKPRDFRYLYTRHLASRFFNRFIKRIILPECNDTQAGLKGFTQEAATFLFPQLQLTGFSFDVELLFLAHRAGLTSTEIPIHYTYQEEPSTVDFVGDAIGMVRDIFRIRQWAEQGVYALQSGQPRQLVLHADDFGLSDGITDGILAGMQAGAITSTSLMVNLPTSARALKLAQEHHLDLGWHLNLTLGSPVSLPEQVPSLINEQGQFHSLQNFLLRVFTGQIKAQEVAWELNAQWELFKRAGLNPSHVDGHQHVHVLPIIRDQLRNLVTQEQIPYVRLPAEPGGMTLPRFLARFFLRSLRGSEASFWESSGAKTLPFFGLSVAPDGDRLGAWHQLLNRIQAPVTELMLHPGLPEPYEDLHGDDFPGDRREELAFLQSEEWRQLLVKLGFSIISFRDLISREPRRHPE